MLAAEWITTAPATTAHLSTPTASGVPGAVPVAIPAADGPLAVSTVTLEDVPIARLGTWAASTGPIELTEARFRSILAAAADPEIDEAAAHPGHSDPRFPAILDGEPALGWVKPTRITDGVLYADIRNVPRTLVDAMLKGWKRRSVELEHNVRTSRGVYSDVLTGLGFLGVQTPAVKGMADVQARYATAAAATHRATTVIAFGDDTPPAVGSSWAGAAPGGHDGPVVSPPSKEAAAVASSKMTRGRVLQLLALEDGKDVAGLVTELTKLGIEVVEDPTAPAPTAPVAPAPPAAVTPPAPLAQAPAAAPTAPVAAPAAPAAAPLATAASAAAPVADGFSAGQLAQLTQVLAPMLSAVAAPGQSALAAVQAQQDETLLQSCLSAGRVSVAEVEATNTGFRAALADPARRAGAVHVLSMLPVDRVPVHERGSSSSQLSAAGTAASGMLDDLDKGWGVAPVAPAAPATTGAVL